MAIPVLQGVAFVHVGLVRSLTICFGCASGGFLGSVCLATTLGQLKFLTRGFVDRRIASASNLLRRYGAVAGLINGLMPLTIAPLVVAAKTLSGRDNEGSRSLLRVLILASVGRFSKFVWMALAVHLGKTTWVNRRLPLTNTDSTETSAGRSTSADFTGR
eukprot:TRINITY_DN52471_c0_g1_i1.p1 TRINITY_DN52471_c0_g1~~TRINITY_DN52471_c0_g1_i1.p1  ORF type:complete len:160 (-),score=9.04 TRINITY_DN52471_c0_g1_i1:35-514(-)